MGSVAFAAMGGGAAVGGEASRACAKDSEVEAGVEAGVAVGADVDAAWPEAWAALCAGVSSGVLGLVLGGASAVTGASAALGELRAEGVWLGSALALGLGSGADRGEG